jgi:hypothetical protein
LSNENKTKHSGNNKKLNAITAHLCACLLASLVVFLFGIIVQLFKHKVFKLFKLIFKLGITKSLESFSKIILRPKENKFIPPNARPSSIFGFWPIPTLDAAIFKYNHQRFGFYFWCKSLENFSTIIFKPRNNSSNRRSNLSLINIFMNQIYGEHFETSKLVVFE